MSGRRRGGAVADLAGRLFTHPADRLPDGGAALGFPLLEARFALAAAVQADATLRPDSRRMGAYLAYRYHPGRALRASGAALGQDIGIAARTAQRAIAQLRTRRYVADCDHGWIIPILEAHLPAHERALELTATQLEFPFLSQLPASIHAQLAPVWAHEHGGAVDSDRDC